MPASSYLIERYRYTRYFALYDEAGLVAVTTYRKGAAAVKDRLEAQDTKIAALQAQFNALAAATLGAVPVAALPTPAQNGGPSPEG